MNDGPPRRFVGRRAERAAMDDAWARAQAGVATVVFIHGPAGFGKTTLVADFLRRAAPDTARAGPAARAPSVLHAIGDPDEAMMPFGVLDQLFRPAVARGGALPGPLADAVAGRPVNPVTLGTAVLAALQAAGADRPGLVMVVDDVQWADVTSLRALVFALRRLRDEPVLAVLACRDGALDRLPAGLRRLRQDIAVGVALGPFDAADMTDLAAARGATALSSGAVDRLTESSAGSPLHATALLAELSVDQLEGDPTEPLPAPRTFVELVAGRIAAGSDAARDLARGLAVLGDGYSLRLAGQLVGSPDPRGAAQELCTAGMLAAPLLEAAVRFAHPLTRSAVYHGIPVTERAELHRRAAALMTTTDAAAGLRHRVAATAGLDARLAAEVAESAAADIGRGAWAVAAEGFRMAADLCGSGDPDHARYTLRMVECLALGGDVAATQAAAVRLERFERSSVRDYCLGRLHALGGDLAAAVGLLQSAWDLLETRKGPGSAEPVPADPVLAARIAGECARVAVMTGRGEDALTWSQRAIGLASPDDAGRGDAMAVMLLAFGILGRLRDGLALVAGLPETVDQPTPAQLDGIVGRGLLSLWADDLPRAYADLDLAVRVTRKGGPVHLNLYVSAFLADTTYRMGRWDLTIAEAETGAALSRDLDNAWTLPMLHALAAMPHAARGHFDIARAHVDAALAAAHQVGDIPSYLWAVISAARLARARLDMPAVVAAFEPLTEIAHLDGVREPGVQAWQSLYASALVSVGRLDDAASVIAEAAELAARRQHRVEQLAVERARARLAAARGDLGGALDVMNRSVDLYRSIGGRPFETAQFDLLHGVLLRRAGRRAAAAAALRTAQTVFLSLGAAPWVDRTAAELRRCGVGRRAAAGADLTAHEQLVADLVAQGMSNRRIAAELGVTPKAVEYHLGNVYAKLGVHSRVQLVTLRRQADSGRPLN